MGFTGHLNLHNKDSGHLPHWHVSDMIKMECELTYYNQL